MIFRFRVCVEDGYTFWRFQEQGRGRYLGSRRFDEGIVPEGVSWECDHEGVIRVELVELS